MGDIKFVGSENVGTPGTVSQWQNGEFEVVWPPKLATAKLNPAKACLEVRPPPKAASSLLGLTPSRAANRKRPRMDAGVAPVAYDGPSTLSHYVGGCLVELIASGLITGGIYALVALGLNLQYGLMRILNIAHGEFLMLGAYLTWMVQTQFGVSPLLMVPVSFAMLMVLGWVIHWLCFRRLTATSPNLDIFEARGLMVAFGLMFLVQNLVSYIWGGDLRGYDFLTDPVKPWAARSLRATSCWCLRWRWCLPGADCAAAHDAAGQGRARADAVAHRRAAGGH
jgi:hypothetical protein